MKCLCQRPKNKLLSAENIKQDITQSGFPQSLQQHVWLKITSGHLQESFCLWWKTSLEQELSYGITNTHNTHNTDIVEQPQTENILNIIQSHLPSETSFRCILWSGVTVELQILQLLHHMAQRSSDKVYVMFISTLTFFTADFPSVPLVAALCFLSFRLYVVLIVCDTDGGNVPLCACVCNVFLFRGKWVVDPLASGQGHSRGKPSLLCHLLVGATQGPGVKLHTVWRGRTVDGYYIYTLKINMAADRCNGQQFKKVSFNILNFTYNVPSNLHYFLLSFLFQFGHGHWVWFARLRCKTFINK